MNDTTTRTADPDARMKAHPMYTPSDLAYFREKGYTDDEIIAFWDRDLARGHRPVEHWTTATPPWLND